jgi:hypothetical protein
MSATARQVQAAPPPQATVKTRVIRFASPAQVKKAAAWSIKKYAPLFKKLAE